MAKQYAIGFGSAVYPINAKSERGAKNAATRRFAGFADSIGYISTINNMYICTHICTDALHHRWRKV